MNGNPTDNAREEPNADRTGADAERDDERTIEGLERRNFLQGLAAAGALGAASSSGLAAAESPISSESGWEMKEPQLETPWTADVGPDNAHPEYPRPQLVRDDWENLNGVWQFGAAAEDESPPFGRDLGERILVPYPVESGLSGIKRHETWMWYRRQFTVSDEWLIPTAHSGNGVENNPNAQRLLLHFERVDWETTVYVNGEEVTRHRGGYDHFVADVTDYLTDDGPQELVIGVFDPTGGNYEPIGTQPKGRQGVDRGIDRGLWKTSTSGIWDTVWMEPVPETAIENLEMTPDVDAEALRLTVEANADDATVVATAYDGDEKAGRVIGPANEELELPVPDPHLWSPDDPFLYDLEVELRRADGDGQVREAGGGKVLDSVESYFGVRSLGKQEVAGTARPTLNGEMIYHLGSLESGMWPDGLYTAPTDEALAYNLELQKELGYNMVRKHSKVETRRWFYHADRLGLLVWQDIPNMEEFFDTPPRDRDELDHFKVETEQMVTEHDTHPSMAVWTPFNEGWGINNDNHDFIGEVTKMVSDLDPERLVDANSGYNIGTNTDSGAGNIKDYHQYGTPQVASPDPEPDRVSALGEYTSRAMEVEEHSVGEWNQDATPEEFVGEYVETIEQLREHVVGRRLSASVYTATTDLYGVWNGHITYDREVLKPTLAENGLARVREAHETLLEQSRRVMGNLVVDVETPSSYVSGELLGNAQPFEVSVTVSNPESTDAVARPLEDVSVNVTDGVPDDWTVTTASGTSFDAIADGESATVTWDVTPDATADGDVAFDVTVDYTIDGESYQFDTTRTVSAAQLAYWRFENGPADDSSYDNPLTLRNGASFDDETAVEADYSMHLDGEDDYALISDSGSGILHDAFAERTVSMWVDPDAVVGSQVLFNEGGYHNGMGLRIDNGSLEAIVMRNDDPGTVEGAFTQTDWTHVAVVFDHGALRLYVNGEELAANEDVGYDTVPGHVAGSALGGAQTTTPWVFDDEQAHNFGGYVDATAIHNVALSARDVEAAATRSFAVDAPDLYASGSDPGPFTVDATFSDLRADDGTTFENLSMSVFELPDGWSSEARTDTEFDAVPDGESATVTWEVTPAPDATGRAELEVAVDYETDGERRRLVNGTTLDTLTSAALALWRFNGTTEDYSGNDHAASLENGASYDDQVVVEGSHSVALDGEDDFIDLAEPQEYLSESFSERTVSTWIDPDTTAGSRVIYNQGAAVNGMAVRINDGTLEAATVDGNDQVTVSVPFDRTEWTHVAVTFDRGALRLYVDGEEADANEDVGYDSVSGAYWGGELGAAESSFWSGHFDGNVDESAVYPFALSSDLIAALAGAY